MSPKIRGNQKKKIENEITPSKIYFFSTSVMLYDK